MDTKAILYIAGFVDGEGSIGLTRCFKVRWCPLQPRLYISNTNLKVLKFIQQNIGGFIQTKKRRFACKILRNWQMLQK